MTKLGTYLVVAVTAFSLALIDSPKAHASQTYMTQDGVCYQPNYYLEEPNVEFDVVVICTYTEEEPPAYSDLAQKDCILNGGFDDKPTETTNCGNLK